jgi:light-regulated signal transduction histidine kinase (bacteriophytochrome)
MAALVRELIIIADEEGRDHGRIDWQVDDLPPADADRALLRLVLTNLLSNAIKYSAGIDDPAIHVGCIRIEGSPPCYFVRDNGVGFDPAKAGKLFGLFQRFHDPKKFSGHGIGLAIAKRAVDKHQGRIWAESSPGAGATFYFTLQTEPS